MCHCTHLLFKIIRSECRNIGSVGEYLMNIHEINNEYGYEGYEYLDEVLEIALKHEHVENASFSIIFVGNEEIQKINREYRGIDRVTDVISFALEDFNDGITDETRLLGDIYVCIPRMKEQALEYGHSEKRELSFLCVHGLLHLLGYDHTKSKEEEKIMFSLQEEILNEAGISR